MSSHTVNDDPPDLPLSPEDQATLDALPASAVLEIDRALMSNCAGTWRKVARVVGTTMMTPPFRTWPIADVCYATRVVELVRQGKLEADGNLDYMRYSEVRLAEPK